MSTSPTPRWTIKGRHVLLALVGFFGICAVVDGFMIYSALSTFGGVDNAAAYREGLAYNDRIAREDAQNQKGWRDSVEVLPEPKRIRVAILDRSGKPVSDLNANAVLSRPATNRFDVAQPLRETAPGQFETDVSSLEPGAWIIRVRAFAQGEEHSAAAYEMRRRVWLKP